MRGPVNAHVHLELPALPSVGGQGLVPWLMSWRKDAPARRDVAMANARYVAAMGTAAVIDIGNLGVGGEAMHAAGLDGLAFTEVFGFDQPHLADGVEHATPHAPYSTHADTIRCVAARGEPWSIHCDEDVAERAFLADGSGPWPDVLRASKRDLSHWRTPGLTPVRWLDSLGVLGPNTLLVHCTLTTCADLELIADRGCTICICPRSNLHITGRLPDVLGMFDAGVRVLIGTDSLISSPDLDVRNELPVLLEAFPGVPRSRWERCLHDDAWDFLDQAGGAA